MQMPARSLFTDAKSLGHLAVTKAINGAQVKHFACGIGQALYHFKNFPAIHSAFGEIQIEMRMFCRGIFCINTQPISFGVFFFGPIKIDGRIHRNLFHPTSYTLQILQIPQILDDFKETCIHTFHGLILIDGIATAHLHHNGKAIFIQDTLTLSVIVHASLYNLSVYQMAVRGLLVGFFYTLYEYTE